MAFLKYFPVFFRLSYIVQKKNFLQRDVNGYWPAFCNVIVSLCLNCSCDAPQPLCASAVITWQQKWTGPDEGGLRETWLFHLHYHRTLVTLPTHRFGLLLTGFDHFLTGVKWIHWVIFEDLFDPQKCYEACYLLK